MIPFLRNLFTPKPDPVETARTACLKAAQDYADAYRRKDSRSIHHALLAFRRAKHRLLFAEWEAGA